LLAVKAGAVATPFELVVVVIVVAPPGKVPLGPVLGAVKVTTVLAIGLPVPSRTVAAKLVPKVVEIIAL
jgi:hypothetical protein